MATKNIQQITLTNFKGHSYWASRIDGKSFMLVGRNGAKKSTVLQAIDHLLQNSPLPPDAVTVGEEEGSIELLLAKNGDLYKVTRKFAKGKDGKTKLGRYELKKDAGNGRFDHLTPAQERFNEIFGNVLDLGPLMDMDGKAQMEFIQTVIGKDHDTAQFIESIKIKVKELREDRLLKGREKRDLEAKMNDPSFRMLVNYVDEPPIDIEALKAKKIDTLELERQKAAAEPTNQRIDAVRVTLNSLRSSKDHEINLKIDELIGLFERHRIDTAAIDQQLAEAKKHNDKVDAEIAEALERNRLIAKSVEYTQVKANIAAYAKEYDDLTHRINDELGQIPKALSKLGIESIYDGLSLKYELDEDGNVVKEGLFLRELPFHRRVQSYGEMIKVLVLLSKAINPDGFNFISIGHWNELDEYNQNAVLQLAKDYDIQLGIEKVAANSELIIELIET
jgi:DNA repair exonuclease SbcCD ATPase subunit